jgi:hypothetical protein
VTKKNQIEELEELKTRMHVLERALVAVIDVLQEEIEKTDAYALFKRMRKLSAIPAMRKALDDARALISSKTDEYQKALDDAKEWDQLREK